MAQNIDSIFNIWEHMSRRVDKFFSLCSKFDFQLKHIVELNLHKFNQDSCSSLFAESTLQSFFSSSTFRSTRLFLIFEIPWIIDIKTLVTMKTKTMTKIGTIKFPYDEKLWLKRTCDLCLGIDAVRNWYLALIRAFDPPFSWKIPSLD